jgi:hypothetical protein
MLHTLRFSFQNAVYFIMLLFLVPVLFTFYIQVCQNLNVKFKVCKSVHHRTIQINHQPNATVFSVYFPDVSLQLNKFRAFSPPIIRSSMTAVAASGFTFVSW